MLRYLQTGCALCIALGHVGANQQVTTIDLGIPDTPIRDEFYILNVSFAGQSLPLMLDTGSTDILVGSNECNNKNSTSGCYKTKLFQIPNDIDIIKNETFNSIVGSGSVTGNQSIMDVSFGSINVDDLAVPLIYEAAQNEFQGGSFSGILGMGMLSVSREYHYFKQLPPFNKMVKENLLSKPVFSLTVPRYGDPASPKTGKLTLGGIEASAAGMNVTYGDIVKTQTFRRKGPKYAYQAWTLEMQGLRVNGVDIPLPKKGFGENGQFIALMDSGGENLFVTSLFDKAAKHFKGKKSILRGVWAYFDCSQPQLVEFKFNGQWIPIDPLDMIQPGVVEVVNGTQMCKASLQNGNSAFSDVLLGPQLFRNSLMVFDYVSKDLFSVPPRIGIAPITNADAAVKRYASLYKSRLN